MSELGDVSGGETISSAFTNNVKNRTVMRYANAAARDASIPVPVEGDMAYLQAENVITYYASAQWFRILSELSGDNRYVDIGGDTMTGPLIVDAGLTVNGDIVENSNTLTVNGGGSATVNIWRTGIGHYWRFNVGGGGAMDLQYATQPTGPWNTREQWLP